MPLRRRLIAVARSVAALLAVVAVAPLLDGCMAAARHTAHAVAGNERGKASTPDAVKEAQEKAISQVQGGEAGNLIPWTDPKSGLQGTLIWDKAVMMTYSCRRYKQTLSLGTEVLSGTLTACPQGDGTWKIVTTPS